MKPALITLDDLVNGLRAISHDLRWSNPAASAQIDSLIARFEDVK